MNSFLKKPSPINTFINRFFLKLLVSRRKSSVWILLFTPVLASEERRQNKGIFCFISQKQV